jgi:hypothetical protein
MLPSRKVLFAVVVSVGEFGFTIIAVVNKWCLFLYYKPIVVFEDHPDYFSFDFIKLSYTLFWLVRFNQIYYFP